MTTTYDRSGEYFDQVVGKEADVNIDNAENDAAELFSASGTPDLPLPDVRDVRSQIYDASLTPVLSGMNEGPMDSLFGDSLPDKCRLPMPDVHELLESPVSTILPVTLLLPLSVVNDRSKVSMPSTEDVWKAPSGLRRSKRLKK